MRKTILALGADIKNKFLIANGNHFYFGPNIGDLSDVNNFTVFKSKVREAIKNIKPKIIAHDLHPGYFSTNLAKELSSSNRCILSPVQHHHAHIASVMQENNLRKPVIAVSFDGTGFGTDGNIWGGEFLKVTRCGFKRLGYFKYRMMPGAESVIKEPWRMVLSILGNKAAGFIKNVKKADMDLILLMMSKNINSPLTSSVGRLFDAAAALVGICTHASYEAEGPIKLEAMCNKDITDKYEFLTRRDNGCYIIDAEPVFLGMMKDLDKKISKSFIATKFHNTMVKIIVNIVKKLSKETKIKDIALSGGVFQNSFLNASSVKRLKGAGLNVFLNKTNVNDLNISLGQYYVSSSSCKS